MKCSPENFLDIVAHMALRLTFKQGSISRLNNKTESFLLSSKFFPVITDSQGRILNPVKHLITMHKK